MNNERIKEVQAAGNAAYDAALPNGPEAAYDAYREAVAGLAIYPLNRDDYLDAIERADPRTYGIGRQRWSGVCDWPDLVLVKATSEMGLPPYIRYVLVETDADPMEPGYGKPAAEEPVSNTTDSWDSAGL